MLYCEKCSLYFWNRKQPAEDTGLVDENEAEGGTE